ncbi:MAG: hypothetical protein ACT4QC_24380 [Planctomycetaceae bacterium]
MQTRTGAAESLKEQGAKITSKKLPHIGTVHQIDLSGSKAISDKTFELIRTSGMIVMELNLSDTNVTDDQLALLSGKELSGGLARLNLSNTEISDKGIEHLAALGFLGDLNLTNSKVTADGVKSFLKAREGNTLIAVKKTKVRR